MAGSHILKVFVIGSMFSGFIRPAHQQGGVSSTVRIIQEGEKISEYYTLSDSRFNLRMIRAPNTTRAYLKVTIYHSHGDDIVFESFMGSLLIQVGRLNQALIRFDDTQESLREPRVAIGFDHEIIVYSIRTHGRQLSMDDIRCFFKMLTPDLEVRAPEDRYFTERIKIHFIASLLESNLIVFEFYARDITDEMREVIRNGVASIINENRRPSGNPRSPDTTT